MWVSTCFQHHLLERLRFPHWIAFVPLPKISWWQLSGPFSGLSVLFHWFFKVFIYLAALDLVVEAYEVFVASCGIFRCSQAPWMWLTGSLAVTSGSLALAHRLCGCSSQILWLWLTGSLAVVHRLSCCAPQVPWLWLTGSAAVAHRLSGCSSIAL